MTKDKILITSALLYSNGQLHFGHLAGAYLPADCYARAMRLEQADVLFLSGSDEYGVAITLSAELEGRSPKEHSEYYHKKNLELFKKLNFSFDHYSRTTWDGHVEPVQRFFLELKDNGFIEEKITDQLYSEEDHKFLADRYVVGTCPKCRAENARGDECTSCGASYEATDIIDPKSKLTGSKLLPKPTKNWFMRFDLFKDKLLKWIKEKNWKPTVVNFVESYINDLKPRAITRDSDWGVKIPLPDTEGKCLYVWFDAPIGYISAAMQWAELNNDPEAWKRYWLDPATKLVHFIGKDNIPFHAIFFPAMCMGQNTSYKLVDDLPANEFLNLEGRQFSKSSGWTIDLEEFLQTFDADQIRYYLAANSPETSDSEFSWKDFQQKNNSDLVGKFGNLINRVFVFAKKQCDQKVPESRLEKEDELFLDKIYQLANSVRECYRSYKLRKSTQVFMELVQECNVFFDQKKPWVDAKEPSTAPRMKTTIYILLHCIKVLAFLALPVMPAASKKIFAMLNLEVSEEELCFDAYKKPMEPGHQLKDPVLLFKKIEDDIVEAELKVLESGQRAIKT